MYSAATVAKIRLVQLGFSYLALMRFTEYMYPKSAVVEDGDTYDFIIVGGGTAGSVIANRLTENKLMNILLIEAGGDPPLESNLPSAMLFLRETQYDWNFTGSYDVNLKKCHQKPYAEISAGKMLGGTSALNYMLYSRGHPTDYDSWANITDDITWEWKHVLPYFIKSENVEDSSILNSPDKVNHGIKGNSKLVKVEIDDVNEILESLKSLGHSIHDDNLGYSKVLLSLGSGMRTSSASAYISPIKDRTNLHVLKNALVTKINFDRSKNAVGVDFIDQEGNTVTVKARKEVIVSAGAFNTPKLLMLSGIGPKEQLTSKHIDVMSDLPVGKNLQDHVSVAVPLALEKREQIIINPNKYLASPIVGYTALDAIQKYPDYETHSFSSNPDIILEFCVFAQRFGYDICDNTFLQLRGKRGVFNEVIHLCPKSRGEVKLRSTDPMDPPEIITGYLSNEDDLKKLVIYVKDFLTLVNTTYFRKIGAQFVDATIGKCSNNYEKGSDDYWKFYVTCMLHGLNNFSGTCAMGSVVDSKLRVYGVQRLRIADASIMPTITRGDTYGPVTMIGEKAADFIKKEHHC